MLLQSTVRKLRVVGISAFELWLAVFNLMMLLLLPVIRCKVCRSNCIHGASTLLLAVKQISLFVLAEVLYALIARKLAVATVAHWGKLLSLPKLWCIVVNDDENFLNHPQAAGRLVMLDYLLAVDYQFVVLWMRFLDQPSLSLVTDFAYGTDSEAVPVDLGCSTEDTVTLQTVSVIMQAKESLR